VFESLAEQSGEAMRRMNLPAHHRAALPPKPLLVKLRLLRDEASRAERLLDEAIEEIAPRRR
jgi:hypothetical protein